MFEHTTVLHHDLRTGPSALTPKLLNLPHQIHAAFIDVPEHDVLVVEPRRLRRAYEKLAPVAVWPAVCHRKDAWARVFEGEVLIVELWAVDAPTAGAVEVREVAALDHEVWDDAVEGRVDVQLVGAELAEVLSGFGDYTVLEDEYNAACGLVVDGYVEVRLLVSLCCH